jgi:hypothetical protein
LDGERSLVVPVAAGVFAGGLALFLFLSFWPLIAGLLVVGLIVVGFVKSRTARWTMIALVCGTALTAVAMWGTNQAVAWATTSEFAKPYIARTARFEAMNLLIFRAIPIVLFGIGWLAFSGVCALAERNRWGLAVSTFLVGLIVLGGSGGAYALYGAARAKVKADREHELAECRTARVRSPEEQRKCDQTLALERYLDGEKEHWTKLLREDRARAEQLMREMDQELTRNDR